MQNRVKPSSLARSGKGISINVGLAMGGGESMASATSPVKLSHRMSNELMEQLKTIVEQFEGFKCCFRFVVSEKKRLPETMGWLKECLLFTLDTQLDQQKILRAEYNNAKEKFIVKASVFDKEYAQAESLEAKICETVAQWESCLERRQEQVSHSQVAAYRQEIAQCSAHKLAWKSELLNNVSFWSKYILDLRDLILYELNNQGKDQIFDFLRGNDYEKFSKKTLKLLRGEKKHKTATQFMQQLKKPASKMRRLQRSQSSHYSEDGQPNIKEEEEEDPERDEARSGCAGDKSQDCIAQDDPNVLSANSSSHNLYAKSQGSVSHSNASHARGKSYLLPVERSLRQDDRMSVQSGLSARTGEQNSGKQAESEGSQLPLSQVGGKLVSPAQGANSLLLEQKQQAQTAKKVGQLQSLLQQTGFNAISEITECKRSLVVYAIDQCSKQLFYIKHVMSRLQFMEEIEMVRTIKDIFDKGLDTADVGMFQKNALRLQGASGSKVPGSLQGVSKARSGGQSYIASLLQKNVSSASKQEQKLQARMDRFSYFNQICQPISCVDEGEQLIFYQTGECALREFTLQARKTGLFWFKREGEFMFLVKAMSNIIKKLAEKNIYHGDLTPESIFLVRENGAYNGTLAPRVILNHGVVQTKGMGKVPVLNPQYYPPHVPSLVMSETERTKIEYYQLGRVVQEMALDSVIQQETEINQLYKPSEKADASVFQKQMNYWFENEEQRISECLAKKIGQYYSPCLTAFLREILCERCNQVNIFTQLEKFSLEEFRDRDHIMDAIFHERVNQRMFQLLGAPQPQQQTQHTQQSQLSQQPQPQSQLSQQPQPQSQQPRDLYELAQLKLFMQECCELQQFNTVFSLVQEYGQMEQIEGSVHLSYYYQVTLYSLGHYHRLEQFLERLLSQNLYRRYLAQDKVMYVRCLEFYDCAPEHLRTEASKTFYLEEALRLLGEESVHTIRAYWKMGVLSKLDQNYLQALSYFDRVEQLASRAVEAQLKTAAGPGRLQVAQLMKVLAESYVHQGDTLRLMEKYSLSEQVLKQGLRLMKLQNMKLDLVFADLLLKAGSVQSKQYKSSSAWEAKALRRLSHAQFLVLWLIGEKSYLHALVLRELGSVQRRKKCRDAALALYERSTAILRELLGASHQQYQYNLATLLVKLYRKDQQLKERVQKAWVTEGDKCTYAKLYARALTHYQVGLDVCGQLLQLSPGNADLRLLGKRLSDSIARIQNHTVVYAQSVDQVVDEQTKIFQQDYALSSADQERRVDLLYRITRTFINNGKLFEGVKFLKDLRAKVQAHEQKIVIIHLLLCSGAMQILKGFESDAAIVLREARDLSATIHVNWLVALSDNHYQRTINFEYMSKNNLNLFANQIGLLQDHLQLFFQQLEKSDAQQAAAFQQSNPARNSPRKHQK